MSKRVSIRILAALSCIAPVVAFADDGLEPCVALDSISAYNDYDDGSRETRAILNTVETNHFTPDVESLRRGLTAPLPRDIAFVLRAFPNHYRALTSMASWQLKNKLPQDDDGNVWTARCYFERAIAFAPKNPRLHTLYAVYLHRAKMLGKAVEQYDLAESFGAPNVDFYYNRGLLEVDLGNLDKAQEYADKAYAKDYPLPGLRDKLARARAEQAKRGKSTKPAPARQ